MWRVLLMTQMHREVYEVCLLKQAAYLGRVATGFCRRMLVFIVETSVVRILLCGGQSAFQALCISGLPMQSAALHCWDDHDRC
jgi:hypothetical protein